jgi:hypothetical protein
VLNGGGKSRSHRLLRWKGGTRSRLSSFVKPSCGATGNSNLSPERTALLTLLVAIACAGSGDARADGSPSPAPPSDVLTHFESFILTNCVPCVRESYYIAAVPVPPTKAPTFPGVSAMSSRASTRAGVLRFDLLRAYPLGLKSRQHMAMRVVLSVAGPAEGQLYPLGAGLLDEDEVPVLEASLSQMDKSTASGISDSSMQLVDIEFHVDSVRMGTVRTADQILAYVQVAPTDLPRFALKQVWELPTVFLPPDDIPLLERTVRQVNEKIRAIRSR